MFEWDPEKNQQNIAKHGVDFEDAKHIFGGYTIEFEDNRDDYGEERWCAFGEVKGHVMFVIYTWRGGAIRLISARGATAGERKRYYDHRH